MEQPNKLLQNPQTQEAFNRAVEAGINKNRNRQKLSTLRGLLASPGIKEAMLDILETSSLTEPQKEFLKEIFVKRKSKKEATATVFGRDSAYVGDHLAKGILQNPEVQQFIDLVRTFYMKVAPVAALTEVEIMLDRRNPAGARLAAADSISLKAGITDSGQKSEGLPVNVIINMPQAPQQINLGKPKDDTNSQQQQ